MDDIACLLAADLDASDKPVGRLRAVISTHVAMSVTNRRFYGILFDEESELSTEVRQRYHDLAIQTTSAVSQLLERCIDDDNGPNAGLRPDIAAILIVSMLTSIHRWYDANGAIKPEQLTEQILLVVSGALNSC